MPARYVVLDKQIGETPLALVNTWKSANNIALDIPASYAGRLDPMASGKLLVLLGEECKKQHLYTKLDKEYVIEVLLDARTDTGDVLGIPEYVQNNTTFNASATRKALRAETGIHEHQYPAFSSKTVSGKPLFMYALEGMLDRIEIPTHTEAFYALTLLASHTLTTAELTERIDALLGKAPTTDEPSKVLGANFRIDAIRPAWDQVLHTHSERTYTVLTIKAVVGSGAYMRTLADRIARRLGTHGIMLSIHRSKIGTFKKLPFGLGMWTKTY